MLSGVFAGLAILTKGPVGILLIGLVIVVFYSIRIWNTFGSRATPGRSIACPGFTDVSIFMVAVLIVGGSWFLAQLVSGNSAMVLKFIDYQVRLFTIPDAGHGGHWSYHLWVLLFGMFPASVLAIKSFSVKAFDNEYQRHFNKIMLILFWVVLIIFSIVKTKIVHYSSLCYFPITFMAALTVRNFIAGGKYVHWLYRFLLIFIASLFALITLAIPLAIRFKQQIIDSGIIKDDFAVANLQANVYWSGFEGLGGVLLLTGTIVSIVIMRKNMQKSLLVLFGASLVFVWLTILIYPYKIEKYTQRAVVEFFKSKSQEKCYILNSGYFSYAPAFYAKRMPDDYKKPMWLITGNIDRPFYLVLKEPHYEKWKHLVTHMKLIEKKNGWVFLERLPKQQAEISR